MLLRSTWIEYREALRSFSTPARQFLLSTFLTWAGNGVAQVLFNLYLVETGFRESFVGQAVSITAAGLAMMALPAGVLADRWGRRQCLVLGAVLEGTGMIVRATALHPGAILGASFFAGAGQSLLAISAAPFLTEHSTARERTHLFSSFFAIELLAGVVGSAAGGAVPKLLLQLPRGLAPDLATAYRLTLVAGGVLLACAAIPVARIAEPRASEPIEPRAAGAPATRLLTPIAVNALLIGAGAGLVIPFMNLYFASRFQCSSAQIGLFFSLAQISTAFASMLAPVAARRFGKLRTAIASELLSLPFLVTLGGERLLNVAVVAFCLRATLMQASTPLLHTFVMEALPGRLRARATSLINLVWNVGWALSATLSGWIIQRFGYAVPFYVTAGLYGTAALYFYASFRGGAPNGETEVELLTEEAAGKRGEGPFTE